MDQENNLPVAAQKLKQLEAIAAGEKIGVDSSSLKTRLATFLVAHADKVMDTVAPLESLRETLSEEYISRAMDMLDNPETTPGAIAHMISSIQEMNLYSLQTLKSVLDADKIQTYISIDASDHSNSQVNVLNLDSAQSRARVAKAVAALSKIMEQAPEDKPIDAVIVNEEDSNS